MKFVVLTLRLHRTLKFRPSDKQRALKIPTGVLLKFFSHRQERNFFDFQKFFIIVKNDSLKTLSGFLRFVDPSPQATTLNPAGDFQHCTKG